MSDAGIQFNETPHDGSYHTGQREDTVKLEEEEEERQRERQEREKQEKERRAEEERRRLAKITDVNEEFEKLLTKYEITSECQEGSLEDRMKTLQNELTLKYFGANNIQFALDQATGYVDLSLREKFHVVEAVVTVTLEADPEVLTEEDKKIEFIISLQEQLRVSNPTLARKVVVNVLKMTSQQSPASKGGGFSDDQSHQSDATGGRTNGYDDKTPRKYKWKETQKKIEEMCKDYQNKMKTDDLPEGDINIITTHNLGIVGKVAEIKRIRKENEPDNENNSPVNADHIPPINTFKKAHKMLQEDENLKQNLFTKRPELLILMSEKGNRGLTREVITEHHKLGLTYGNTKEGDRISQKLAETFISGNVVKLMKMSLIVANPEMSQTLREDAELPQRGKRCDILSKEGTRRYHDVGDKLLMDRYFRMGVLNQNEYDGVKKWLNGMQKTPEYRELLCELREINKKTTGK